MFFTADFSAQLLTLSDLACHVFLWFIADMLTALNIMAQEISNAAVLNTVCVVSGMAAVGVGEDWLDLDCCRIRTILS
jgi:hypothetical protein